MLTVVVTAFREDKIYNFWLVCSAFLVVNHKSVGLPVCKPSNAVDFRFFVDLYLMTNRLPITDVFRTFSSSAVL